MKYFTSLAPLMLLLCNGLMFSMEYVGMPATLASDGITPAIFEQAPSVTLADGSTVKAMPIRDNMLGYGVLVTKQHANGSLDEDFGSLGRSIVFVPNQNGLLRDLSIDLTPADPQNPQKIVIHATDNRNINRIIFRFNLSTGMPDYTFGHYGISMILLADIAG
jgi:hypothetical protein